MTVTIRVHGGPQLVEYLAGLPTAVTNMILAKFTARASDVSKYIKEELLSGQLLGVKTGRLRSSIVARTYSSKSKVTLSVASRGDVPYAAIYEYGGKIPPHVIRAKRASLLVFMGEYGSMIGVPKVNHPGSEVRARAYLRTGVADKFTDFLSDVEAAVVEAELNWGIQL